MKIVFHYLAGTRNSLKIARKLASCFQGTDLVPVIGDIRSPLLRKTMQGATPAHQKSAMKSAPVGATS